MGKQNYTPEQIIVKLRSMSKKILELLIWNKRLWKNIDAKVDLNQG